MPETTVAETTTPASTEPSTTETTLPPTTTGPIETITVPIGQPFSNITRKDLAAARERWASAGFDAYSITVDRSCFCLPDSLGPFKLLVRDGRVEAVKRIDGQPVSDQAGAERLTVSALFDLIDESFDSDSLTVKFDDETGIPLTISIDGSGFMVDDELTIRISEFGPNRNG